MTPLKRFLAIGFLVLTTQIYAQEKQELLGFNFENATLAEIFQKIEGQTGIRIYYLDSWIEETKYTGEFSRITTRALLDSLLRSTKLNHFLYDNRTLIITQNRRIYDQLPSEFFGGIKQTTAIRTLPVENSLPIFINEPVVPNSLNQETFSIGKQSAVDNLGQYELQGFVLHRESSTPMPDVAVLIRDIGKGAVTDESGYFSFQLPAGIYELETRHLGMRPVVCKVILYGNGSITLNLEEGLQQLNEVVVQASQDRNVEEVLAGTDQINAEESKEIPLILGERNLLKIATALPGISTAGEGAGGINVRGGRSDQNQFLLNGGSVYNPTHFFGLFQAINPFVLQQVAIYKGVIPVQFGGRLSAVFDMQTKTGDTTKIKGEGAIGPVTSNLALEIPVVQGKSALVLGGRMAYSDWILRSLKNSKINGNQAAFYDLIATYSDKIDSRNRLRATAYYSKDVFSLTRDSLLGYSNRMFSMSWNRLLPKNHNLDVDISNSRHAFNLTQGLENLGTAFNFQLQETALGVSDRFRSNTKNLIRFGLSAKYYQVAPGNLDPLGLKSAVTPVNLDRERAVEAAVYLSNRFSVDERFEIDYGLRWTFFSALGPALVRSYSQEAPRNTGTLLQVKAIDAGNLVQFYNGPEFRTAARYLLDPTLSIRAGFNSMYQYLHALSNTTTVSPIDTWKLSDNNIRPQQAYLSSLGIFKNYPKNDLELSVEGYYKWSKDVLDFKSGARILLNDHLETEVLQGNGRAYGLEFLVRKNQGKLNGWLGYTWSRALIQFQSPFSAARINGGLYFPSNYDRPHDLSLIANYRFTKRYSVSMNFAFQTGRPVTYPIGQFVYNNAEYVLYSDRNKYRIPDYYRLDLGINVEGNHKKQKLAHSFWTFSVYNVLGRNNPYSVFFVTEKGEVKALQSSIFAVPVPSITYNFKF
ncbi:MAG: hypothetical protein RLZZ241_1839 [Bacteroidota bacterium]|jgi:hypothetical protein